MINRQELYDLLGALPCDEESASFCACSIVSVFPDFENSYENENKLCENSLNMLSDEELHSIFHDTVGLGEYPEFPVWYREHIPETLLEKFPFLYEQTEHTLYIALIRILSRHGGGMKYNDLCVEFMALYRDCLSDSERKTYRGLLLGVISKSPQYLTKFYYEGIESYEIFVGTALSKENKQLLMQI